MYNVTPSRTTLTAFCAGIVLSVAVGIGIFVIMSTSTSRTEAHARTILQAACAKTSKLDHFERGVQTRHTGLDFMTEAPVSRLKATPQVPVVAGGSLDYVTRVAGTDYHVRIGDVRRTVPEGVEPDVIEIMYVDDEIYYKDALTEQLWVAEKTEARVGGAASGFADSGVDYREQLKTDMCQFPFTGGEEYEGCESLKLPLYEICATGGQSIQWEIVDIDDTTRILISIEIDRKGNPKYTALVDELLVYSFHFWIDSSGYIVERRLTNRLLREGHFVAVILDQVITIALKDPVKLEPPI